MNPSVATSSLDVPIPISPKNHYAHRGYKPSNKQYNMPTFRSWIGLRICISPSLPAGINDKGATPTGVSPCPYTRMGNEKWVRTRRHPQKGGGVAPVRSLFRSSTPHQASIRCNHSGGSPIEKRVLGNGTQKSGEMGSNSISHARSSPGLGNGVPIFGQVPLQENASNPALPRVENPAISKSQKSRSGGNPRP